MISAQVTPQQMPPMHTSAPPYSTPVWKRSHAQPNLPPRGCATDPRPKRALPSLVTRQLKSEEYPSVASAPHTPYRSVAGSSTIPVYDKASLGSLQQQLQSVDIASSTESPAPQRKPQSQLENDAETKQKRINRVFMNLKIAEKVLEYNFMLRLNLRVTVSRLDLYKAK